MVVLSIIAASSIGLFLVVFWRAGIMEVAREAIAIARGAAATVRAPDLDDLAREQAVQAAALRLLTLSAILILRSLLALAAAFVPIALCDWTGLAPMAATLDFMERWDVIAVATVAICAGYWASLRLWPR